MMRLFLLAALLSLAAPTFAQDRDFDAPPLTLSSPYTASIREHYYRVLARSPAKAFAWELLPGAGHVYTGFYLQAAISATLTLTGASLWVAGAVRDNDALWWAGASTFGAGRLYGLVSAPVSAALLNAAYRRQFGIVRHF